MNKKLLDFRMVLVMVIVIFSQIGILLWSNLAYKGIELGAVLVPLLAYCLMISSCYLGSLNKEKEQTKEDDKNFSENF